jgi:hypothetical protein
VTDAAPPPREPGPVRAIGRGTVGAVVVLAVVVGAVWWSSNSDDDTGGETPGATSGPPYDEIERDERASAILRDLGTAWARADQPGFVAAAGDSELARRWARQVYGALADLQVRSIDLRYVAADPESTAEDSGFTADVEVRWGVPAGGQHRVYLTAPVTVPLRFAYDGAELSVVGLDGDADDPIPVWLTGSIEIETTSGGACVGVPASVDLEACADLVEVAARDLKNVVSDGLGRRPVVVMVPEAASTAAMLLGQEADDLEQIAAVTATVDGSGSLQAPAQVVLNPAVFDDLGRRAAQLVVSHEATHAATGATGASMELWVAEGFADYVALASERIPVERAASQILDYVRNQRTPDHLPTAKEFSAHRHGLGRTYEAAWLAFRMLGSYYGNEAVVEFYAEVRAGTPVEEALLDTVGLDLAGLTAAWQEYLSDLAFGTV